ncbi:DUF2255 family protein [Streptomyces sp. NBC_01317]|uniref:DUF2255 family protein n=1 Tax=Streptomyces sp. NBC_01317 TaxID=2903822 RepID=UPI002E11C851|nr:DUF2255 family protein [Streptomyces sp. NBC_01317]
MTAAIDYLANTDTVRIATELSDGGEVVTPIWSVVVDDTAYIRSAYGPDSKWYRRVSRSGRAKFVDGAQRYPVTVEPVDDDSVNENVDGAYRSKYAASPSLPDLLNPDVRGLTLRVIPQGG